MKKNKITNPQKLVILFLKLDFIIYALIVSNKIIFIRKKIDEQMYFSNCE